MARHTKPTVSLKQMKIETDEDRAKVTMSYSLPT